MDAKNRPAPGAESTGEGPTRVGSIVWRIAREAADPMLRQALRDGIAAAGAAVKGRSRAA